MEFTPQQGARLANLIRTGCERAATALTDCTGLRIGVETPAVSIRSMPEALVQVQSALGGKVAAVVQRFSGALSGQAMFLLDEPSSHILSDAIAARGPVNIFDLSASEVLLETGSIILNACVGALGNLLAAKIDFAVPILRLQAPSAPPGRGWLADGEPAEAVVVQTRLRLNTSNLPCYVTIAIGFHSLERLLTALDRWTD